MYVPTNNKGRKNAHLLELLIGRIDKQPSGCWNWTGKTVNGYGDIIVDKKHWPAYRYIYWLCRDEDIEGKHIHHLCENRACVNPRHLQALTVSEHKRIHLSKRPKRSHCKHGHPWIPLNVRVNSLGYEQCIECRRQYNRKRREKKADQASHLTITDNPNIMVV